MYQISVSGGADSRGSLIGVLVLSCTDKETVIKRTAKGESLIFLYRSDARLALRKASWTLTRKRPTTADSLVYGNAVANVEKILPPPSRNRTAARKGPESNI